MARLLTNAEIWAAIDTVGIIRDVSSGASDSLAAAAAEGDTALTLNSASTFVNDDLIRVGDVSNWEVAKIETGGGTTSLTLVSPLAYAHASGEAVVEQERVEIGETDDSGISVEHQADRTAVNAATRRQRLANLIGNVNSRLSFMVENHSLENVLLALGIDEANIGGAGTAADPSVADITPDDWGELDTQFHSLYFTGSLKDGTTVESQAWRASFDPNQTKDYARGNPALLPFNVDIEHVRYYQPAL